MRKKERERGEGREKGGREEIHQEEPNPLFLRQRGRFHPSMQIPTDYDEEGERRGKQELTQEQETRSSVREKEDNEDSMSMLRNNEGTFPVTRESDSTGMSEPRRSIMSERLRCRQSEERKGGAEERRHSRKKQRIG